MAKKPDVLRQLRALNETWGMAATCVWVHYCQLTSSIVCVCVSVHVYMCIFKSNCKENFRSHVCHMYVHTHNSTIEFLHQLKSNVEMLSMCCLPCLSESNAEMLSMSVTCMSHVCYMYVTCTYITCMSNVCHMYVTCLSHVCAHS